MALPERIYLYIDKTPPIKLFTVYSVSPVMESHKTLWVQRKFLLHVLIWHSGVQKNLGANHKMVNQLQKLDFQNGGKAPWTYFQMWGQNLNAYDLYIVGKEYFIRINIALRTRVQNCKYFKLLIENRRDIFLKAVVLY